MATIGGISGMGAAMKPQAMSGASMRMPPQQKMNNLFQAIDTAGTGSITKEQFKRAFNLMNPPAAFKAMGSDAVFAKLDPNNTGKVSKSDFIAGMKTMMTPSQPAAVSGQLPKAATLAKSTAAMGALGNNVNTKA